MSVQNIINGMLHIWNEFIFHCYIIVMCGLSSPIVCFLKLIIPKKSLHFFIEKIRIVFYNK